MSSVIKRTLPVVNMKHGIFLNFVVNTEKHVDKVLTKLVESNSVI